MKKSKKPSVRIKRAVKQLTDVNPRYEIGNVLFEQVINVNPRYEIGNVLFEQIINLGVQEAKSQLKEMDKTKNHFISPSMWEECIEILEENLQIKY